MTDPAPHNHQQPSLPPNAMEAAERQRAIILRAVRMGFLALITTVALLLTIQAQQSQQTGVVSGIQFEWWLPVAFAVVLFCVTLLADLYTPNKKISTIAGVFIGLIAGMLATAAVAVVLDLLLASYVQTPKGYEAIQPLVAMLKVMIGISLCYLGISTVLQTQDDFRLVIPYVEFAKQIRGVRPNVLDTSALIDARIADVAATGLLQSALVIPRFVLGELQMLADSSDRLKRARGRRGLDVVTRLQRLGTLDILIDESPVIARAVDQMLVELAQKLSARILTTDLGLTRVAQIHGVTVLNLHDIANTFKPALIPGEQIVIKLVKPGEQAGQGVGYLDDGTMVVAEGGMPYIGEDVTLLVTSTMQTTAGRLVFARPADPVSAPSHPPQPHQPPQPSPHAPRLPRTPEPADQPSADLPAAAQPEEPEPGEPGAEAGEPAETGSGQTPAASSTPALPARSGPFPPKPPSRRPGSARNPRRWPPAE